MPMELLRVLPKIIQVLHILRLVIGNGMLKDLFFTLQLTNIIVFLHLDINDQDT